MPYPKENQYTMFVLQYDNIVTQTLYTGFHIIRWHKFRQTVHM